MEVHLLEAHQRGVTTTSCVETGHTQHLPHHTIPNRPTPQGWPPQWGSHVRAEPQYEDDAAAAAVHVGRRSPSRERRGGRVGLLYEMQGSSCRSRACSGPRPGECGGG